MPYVKFTDTALRDLIIQILQMEKYDYSRALWGMAPQVHRVQPSIASLVVGTVADLERVGVALRVLHAYVPSSERTTLIDYCFRFCRPRSHPMNH
jgi:hypothetical protein